MYPSRRVGTRYIDPIDQKLADKIKRLAKKLNYSVKNLSWFARKNNLPISYYTVWSFTHENGVGFPPKQATRAAFIQMKNLLKAKLERAKRKQKQQDDES